MQSVEQSDLSFLYAQSAHILILIKQELSLCPGHLPDTSNVTLVLSENIVHCFQCAIVLIYYSENM